MSRQFISEPIKPDTTTFVTARMATGEPGLPMRFVWRGRMFQITEVLETWRKTGPCRHGSGERYVRRHFYKIRTDSGSIMTIYFDRQYRLRSQRTIRWWLLSEETS